MAGDLGLNESHSKHVVDYLHYVRSKQASCINSIETVFSDVEESRLVEPTFTADEVQAMLRGLRDVVKADVESELIATAHTNVLLLRQLFQQSQTWKITLQLDVSELENRDLIEQVERFEQRAFEKESSSIKLSRASKLDPINSTGGDTLLRKEIQRLEDENKKLTERVRMLESKVSLTLKERDDIRLQLDTSAHNQPMQNAGSKESEDKLAQVTCDLKRVSEELQKTKEELEKSFNDTAQYQNMKKILNSKNEQIKELRGKLKQYEKDDAN